MTDLILTEQSGAVRTLTLNDVVKRNPISHQPMIQALIQAVKAADDDLSVRAIVLTGAGTAFSAGGDVRKMGPGEGLRDASPVRTRINYREGIHRLTTTFQSISVPVIAAVNGPAIGAGCDLACLCDIRIASEDAKFASSFVKVGLVAGDGGAWLLPRIVGFPKACELMLTGDTIDAAEALACALVSKVVPPASLMSEALAMAERMAVNSPHAVRMTKRLLREGQRTSLDGLLELSAAMQALAHDTADHEEAIAAFRERRAPTFRAE